MLKEPGAPGGSFGGGGVGMGCMLSGGRGKRASTVAEMLLVLPSSASELLVLDEAKCSASRLAAATSSLILMRIAFCSCSVTASALA